MANRTKEAEARQERTFDRAAELLKANPGAVDRVAEAVSRDADKHPEKYDRLAPAQLRIWIDAGLQRPKRIKDAQVEGGRRVEMALVREPIRNILADHAARAERATDESVRHMTREVRRAAADNGARSAGILTYQGAFLYKLTEAVMGRSEPGAPKLHEVTIALCKDMAAELAVAKLSNEQRWVWVRRITSLLDGIIRSSSELARAEAAVAGRDRSSLLHQGTEGKDGAQEDRPISLTADALLQQSQEITAALQSIADIGRGVLDESALRSFGE